MNYIKIAVLQFSFVLALNVLFFLSLSAQESEKVTTGDDEWVSEFYEDNEKCFRCHGQTKYTIYNEFSDRDVNKLMCDCRVISREDYYNSNHKSFACVDCHDSDYETFPHTIELRLEEHYACLDCHGYDETYAQYHFEEIEEEFAASIHAELEEEGFSCWSCHNPHSYKINIRNTTNLSETIAYDNNICLDCHSDFSRFHLLTEREEINIIEQHDWLPNQALHFAHVRCIECHTLINDSILVAHHLVPKEQAVQNCVECHSQDSRLLSTLYKFEAKEQRNKVGFWNGAVLQESYVIGANRNIYLNVASVIIFLLIVSGIVIHIYFRIRMNKNKTSI